jgi:multidrug resistance efflux pump
MSIGVPSTRILSPFLTQPGALRFDANQRAILASIISDSISTRSFIRSHHRWIKSPKVIILCCYEKSVGPFAAEQRAHLAYSSEIEGVNTTVARLTADLRDAEYNLDHTTVRAPTNGYVTQLFLRPGMMAASSPTMIFIHADDLMFAAAFPQTTVQRLRSGEEAEIAFDAIPGRVFQGKVDVLIDAVSQGQLQASSALLNPEDRAKTPGLALVRITIGDDLSSYQLPAGATAQVAVYSDHWRGVAVIRRILLRMKSWMNCVI